jgi:hypothetical protein
MKAIGAKGFASTVARHYQGDKAAYLPELRERGWNKLAEGFADREIARRMEKGEETVCLEIPIVGDPDEDMLPW